MTVAAREFAERTGFPLATLVVNLLGSFLLGFVATVAVTRVAPADLRLIVGLGFLGAFTTFSTFELDCLRLLEQRAFGQFAIYAGGNLLIGFVAVIAGQELARRVG